MKRIISFITIFVIFINLFAFPIPVKADGVPVPGYSELKEMQEDIQNGDNRTVQDIWKILQPIGQAVGIVMNPIQTIEFIRDVVDPVAQTLPDYPTNGSDTDKANYLTEYIVNNTTTNDNNKTYTLNQNARTLVNGVVNNYINNTGMYYVYSFDLLKHISYFQDGERFAALRRLVSDNQDNYNCFYTEGDNSRLYLYPNTSDICCVYNSTIIDGIQWDWIASLKNWQYVSFVKAYEYNGSTKQYDLLNNTWGSNRAVVSLTRDRIYDGVVQSYYGGRYVFVTNNRTSTLKCYTDQSTMQNGSQGIQPYYYNNTVYTNYKNSSGDFTVTTDNSNHATYGDITTYIDNSTNDNGNPPNSDEINIYIENVPVPTPTPTPTPTLTPDNPSGGGTVSGNTNNGGTASASATANNNGVNVTVNNNHNINLNVPGLSGNGIGSGTVSGNGNGTGGIFDWISDIGGVIGDFIKNVGQLIADVIKGITETITTVLADIPNIISVLVEFVYGGLPDELKAIVTLGITTVIFVGVIKMMRK